MDTEYISHLISKIEFVEFDIDSSSPSSIISMRVHYGTSIMATIALHYFICSLDKRKLFINFGITELNEVSIICNNNKVDPVFKIITKNFNHYRLSEILNSGNITYDESTGFVICFYAPHDISGSTKTRMISMKPPYFSEEKAGVECTIDYFYDDGFKMT